MQALKHPHIFNVRSLLLIFLYLPHDIGLDIPGSGFQRRSVAQYIHFLY